MYHTVWTLHKTKTARLVVTLYRHITDKLPTSYRHITNCRPTVGRQSADRFFGELFFTITQNTAGVHYDVVLQVCCDVADISYICCEKSTIKSAINSSEDKQKYTFTYHEHDSKLLNDWKTHVKAENFNVDVHKKDKTQQDNYIVLLSSHHAVLKSNQYVVHCLICHQLLILLMFLKYMCHNN